MGYPTVIRWTCKIFVPSTYHGVGYQHTSHGTSLESLLLDWKPYSLPKFQMLGYQIKNKHKQRQEPFSNQ